MSQLLKAVRADHRVLWYADAMNHVVYVKREPKGTFFYTKGKSFTAWSGGCGIGSFPTLAVAKAFAASYLRQQVELDRKQALERVIAADKFLYTEAE